MLVCPNHANDPLGTVYPMNRSWKQCVTCKNEDEAKARAKKAEEERKKEEEKKAKEQADAEFWGTKGGRGRNRGMTRRN